MAPKGRGARDVAGLWWPMLWMAVAVYALVLVMLWLATRRSRRGGRAFRSERSFILGWGVVMPVLVLAVLMGITIHTTVRLAGWERAEDPSALRIDVTGAKWWWQLHYPDQGFTTANELHVPTGRPVDLVLRSRDVIHSFWVPEIAGKMDLIPGRENRLRIQVDRPGSYRGVCAEFCGLQHARMRLLLVAQEPGEFERWAAGQAAVAAEPAGATTRRGREVFLSASCVYCHTIRGTPARGEVGPDLTHLASRSTIAALEAPNTRGWLGGWIADPHSIKQGVNMPGTSLPGEDLQALLDYLESLR